MPGRTSLCISTIVHTKPSMLVRKLGKTKRIAEDVVGSMHTFDNSVSVLIEDTDIDPEYLARFDVDGLMQNEMLLINERHLFDMTSWHVSEASHLWNFNLHYFEYAIALGASYRKNEKRVYYDVFKSIVLSWIENCPYPNGDAWHPYTISLRLINWLVCRDLFSDMLENDSDFDERMIRSMYMQYRHLLVNQEKQLLANHYFENLKTLVIFSKLFGEDNVFRAVWQDFELQLGEQVLNDGVHFERSLMYHKLVLEGLLRVAHTLDQVDGSAPEIVLSKIQLMLDAMVSLECGMGKTPFFNDSADRIAKECKTLEKACKKLFGFKPVKRKSFPDAGYYKFYDGDAAILFDAGEPGPSYMLGHAHCDTLSFEVSVYGASLFVNSGTYAYQSAMRSYFRSTAAHNTAMIGNREQMECWGEHRVGRLIKDVSCSCEGDVFRGSYRSYNGDKHVRTLRMDEGQLIVEDAFETNGSEPVRSFLHIAPGYIVESVSSDVNDRVLRVSSSHSGVACAVISTRCDLVVHEHDGLCNYSPQFGVLQEGITLEFVSENGTRQCAYRVMFIREEESE